VTGVEHSHAVAHRPCADASPPSQLDVNDTLSIRLAMVDDDRRLVHTGTRPAP
jgi:hypothetical protein